MPYIELIEPMTPAVLNEYAQTLMDEHDEVAEGELCYCGDCMEVIPRLTAAARRIEALEEALRPFADAYCNWRESNNGLLVADIALLTLDHYKAAAAALGE